jgi:cytochrome bd-type quinol oxidase subunit 2
MRAWVDEQTTLLAQPLALASASASATHCSGHVGSFADATATSATPPRLIPTLSLALLLFLIAAFGFALIEHLRVMNRWLERPYLFVFPAIGIVAAILLASSLQRRSFEPLLAHAPISICASPFHGLYPGDRHGRQFTDVGSDM